jgi:hypothetical protein
MHFLNRNGRDQLGNTGVYAAVILKWMSKKQGVRIWVGFIGLMIGSNVGFV